MNESTQDLGMKKKQAQSNNHVETDGAVGLGQRNPVSLSTHSKPIGGSRATLDREALDNEKGE